MQAVHVLEILRPWLIIRMMVECPGEAQEVALGSNGGAACTVSKHGLLSVYADPAGHPFCLCTE